ncbi:hypothetical protein REPUB_Repub05bG0090900 [Reevesia pubescens]
MLNVNKADWGPKLLRLFNHWLEFEGFNSLVQSTWREAIANIEGSLRIWNGLKNIKPAIKEWQHKEGIAYFGKISIMEEDINKLELEMQVQ